MSQKSESDPLELIRADALAALLGVHIETIRRWTRERKLPKPLKLSGGVTAWRRRDMEAWLQSKEG